MSHRYKINTLDQLDIALEDDIEPTERELWQAARRHERALTRPIKAVEGEGRKGDKRNKPIRVPKERPDFSEREEPQRKRA